MYAKHVGSDDRGPRSGAGGHRCGHAAEATPRQATVSVPLLWAAVAILAETVPVHGVPMPRLRSATAFGYAASAVA